MAKERIHITREIKERQTIEMIMDEYPYLSSASAAYNLAVFELGAKITIKKQYAPDPIAKDEDDE